MTKKILYLLLILIIIITGIIFFIKNNNNIETNNKEINNYKEEDNNIMNNNLKIEINNKEYIINIENNDTTNELIKLLPLELDMKDLNNNEKYIYLNNNLPTNEYNPNYINKGDVMLFGNNCLVIFYKSFNTSYSYTKIGHIDNLDDLDNNNITIKIYR